MRSRAGQLTGGVSRSRSPGRAGQADAIRPENLIWIFGAGRSGSTWLATMMGDLKSHSVWQEPCIGYLLGEVYSQPYEHLRQNPNFILGADTDLWRSPLRSFLLEAATLRFPEVARAQDRQTLVIKEQNGSMGAPLLMQALPESRLVLLVRDPRDIMASALDAVRPQSWGRKLLGEEIRTDLEWWLDGYLRTISKATEAYDSHGANKVVVRYEDLVADTLSAMRRLYRELAIPVGEDNLAKVVDKHGWNRIPASAKGEGKFHRRGGSGGWRVDLSPDQIELIEQKAASVFEDFYPEAETRATAAG